MTTALTARLMDQGRTVWLEISYTGASAPEAVLAALSDIGWRKDDYPFPTLSSKRVNGLEWIDPPEETQQISVSKPGSQKWTQPERKTNLRKCREVLYSFGWHDVPLVSITQVG